MSDAKHLCRFCLKTVPGNESLPVNSSITENLQQLIPDLKLTPSINPITCNACNECLEESQKFKRTCSSSNKLIKFLRNYLGVKQNVDLKELIKGHHKKDEKWPKNGQVCRVCLKGNEGAYTSFKDARGKEYNSILKSCVSVTDENLTTSPMICAICTGTLHKLCKFINQLKDVENKITLHRGKFPSEIVDLQKVVDLVSDEETAFHSEYESECVLDIEEPKTSESNDEEMEEVDSELPDFEFTTASLFVPYEKPIDIKDWMKQVEEIKSKKKWSDFTTKYKILGKMKQIPQLQSWFSSVADVMSWEEWKDKLVHAFPDKDDYYIKIIRMVNRKKRKDENFVEYFHAKLALVEPFHINEEQKVSCLIGGIPDIYTNCIGRSGKYKNPEQLLTYFKLCDEKNQVKFAKKPKRNEPNTIETSSESTTNKTDEKNLIVLLENKVVPVNTTATPPEKQNEAKKNVSEEKCSCCDQKGHSSVNCPLINASKVPSQKTEKTTTDRSPKNIVIHENKLISNGTSTSPKKIEVKQNEATPKKPETQSSVKCPPSATKTPEKPAATTSPPQTDDKKCSYCDKVGHSSFVCPLIDCDKTNTRRSNIRIVLDKDKVKPPIATIQEPGKDDLECIQAKDTTQKSAAAQKKCSCCDKIGHTSLDCPLIGLNRNAKASQSTERGEKARQNKNAPQDKRTPQKTDAGNKSAPQTTTDSRNKSAPQNKKEPQITKVGDKNAPQTTTESRSKSAPQNKKEPQITKVGDKIAPQTTTDSRNKSAPQNKKEPQTTADSRDKSAPRDNVSVKSSEKCSGCDKLGHSIVNCPFIKPNKNADSDDECLPSQATRKCLCCNKVGHSSLDCPLLGLNKNDLLQQSADKKNLYEPEIVSKPSHSQRTERTCTCCNKTGHTIDDCPFYSFFNKNKSASRDNDSVTTPEEKSQRTFDKTRGSSYRPLAYEDQPPQKRYREDSSSSEQKCYFCGSSTHFAVDCIRSSTELNPGDPSVAPMQSVTATSPDVDLQHDRKSPVQANPYPRGLQCDFCGRLGHRMSECFFAKFDRNIYNAHHSSVSTTSRQCLYCGKFGHLQPDCPKNKPPSKRLGSSRPPRAGYPRY